MCYRHGHLARHAGTQPKRLTTTLSCDIPGIDELMSDAIVMPGPTTRFLLSKRLSHRLDQLEWTTAKIQIKNQTLAQSDSEYDSTHTSGSEYGSSVHSSPGPGTAHGHGLAGFQLELAHTKVPT